MLGILFFCSACTSLVREPHYTMIPIDKPSPLKVSKNSWGQPIGYHFKMAKGRKHQTIWIEVLNRGEKVEYAAGLVLPIIPNLFEIFGESPAPINGQQKIELKMRSYSDSGFPRIMRAPEAPQIKLPNGNVISPVVSNNCGYTSAGPSCYIHVYDITPADTKEFTLLKTQTLIDDGTYLETPETRFVFRNRPEILHRRGQ